ncbi:MAG TPA: hypothetical protein DEO89_06880 [Lachnospiraceae bacterium]|nr:hypothetical protein [Lachnospiraceae bacterium]
MKNMIMQKIANINKIQVQEYITNYYGISTECDEINVLVDQKNAFVFSTVINGLEQLFFAGEKQLIIELLMEINGSYVIEVVTRKMDDILWLEKIGYRKFITLQRGYQKSFCNQEIPPHDLFISVAEIIHAKQIMHLIHEKFDYINSKYMNSNQLEKCIREKTVWIATNDNENVEGFLVATKIKATLCIEFVYNGCSGFKAGYFLKIVETYALSNELKLVYVWANIEDERAKTMYNRNGYKWEQRYKSFFIKGME